MQPYIVTGKAVVLAMDDVSTDHIYPVRNINLTDPVAIGKHAMEGVDPNFVQRFAGGDSILVAGNNFASGSSREHAVITLMAAGVKAIIAGSAARIWFRNAINLALPVMLCPGYVREVSEGEELSIDFTGGSIINKSRGLTTPGKAWPEYVATIMSHGGIKPMMLAKHGKKSGAAA